jgi:hypothetical protein
LVIDMVCVVEVCLCEKMDELKDASDRSIHSKCDGV